jgi:fucose permease
MNYFKRKNKCAPSYNMKFTEILGLMIAIIGAIIIVQVLPVKIWFLVLGILLVILGVTLFRLI